MNGGHDVPITKIVSRYQKSIINCSRIVRKVHRAYLYDNSVENAGTLMRQNRKNKRNETARYANENATVDMMLAIKSVKEAGKKVNLNVTDETAKKLIEICPHIISRMSADERVYFDMLIDGDIEIKDEEMFKNFALAVMDGHLRSNPEDLQMVLDAFDETSITVLLSDMYIQNRTLLSREKMKNK